MIIGLVLSLVGVFSYYFVMTLVKPMNFLETKRYNLVVYPLFIVLSLYLLITTGYNLNRLDISNVLSLILISVMLLLGTAILANVTVKMSTKISKLLFGSITTIVLVIVGTYTYTAVYLGQTESGKTQAEIQREQQLEKAIMEVTEQAKAQVFVKPCGSEEEKYYPACSDTYSNYIKTMYTTPNSGEFVDYHYTLSKELAYLEQEVLNTNYKKDFLEALSRHLASTGDATKTQLTKTTNKLNEEIKNIDNLTTKVTKKNDKFMSLTQLAGLNFRFMELQGWTEKGEEFKPATTITTEFDKLNVLDKKKYKTDIVKELQLKPSSVEWVNNYTE